MGNIKVGSLKEGVDTIGETSKTTNAGGNSYYD